MKLKVVSSSKEIYASNEVLEVYLPSEEGRIGILPGHVSLISALEVGELKIKLKDKSKSIFLNGGIIQVKDNKILILADEATHSPELIKDEINTAIKNAEK